jgi:hypothetical protein
LQIIVRVTGTPEEYVAAQKHLSMARPHRCPHCLVVRLLVALGYYVRGLSGTDSRYLRVSVRRFRCRACGRTVSLLPDFAQPYRLVRNEVIERYFSSEMERILAQRNTFLLRCYWQRFGTWLPELRRAVGAGLGRSPPASQQQRWWRFLMDATGDLARATRRLTGIKQVTIFGRYRCHQPRPP